MEFKERAQEIRDYIIERRRYYHAHPELSGEESGTRDQIRRDLEEMGITDIREMKGCYGLVARIQGPVPGRTVALRTDIDALNVQEQTGLPFASENEGVMHACGHDTHIAILLGAAKMLSRCRESLRGEVRLVVQPEEELATGALRMMEEDALEGVDAIYGNHVFCNLPSGMVDVSAGLRMSACGIFEITVEGKAAHGSEPQEGIDAITAAASVVQNLQQLVSRRNDPQKPLVLTIGTIQGGTRFNIIPNRVTMSGTIRCFEIDPQLEDRFRQVVEKTAEALGAKGEVTRYEFLTAPISNGVEELNSLALSSAKKVFGDEGIFHKPAVMGSEDFSWYTDRVPAFFTMIGGYDEEAGYVYSNHHEKFDVDEDQIVRGAALMAQFAFDYLVGTEK